MNARRALTLGAASVLFVGGLFVGFQLLTSKTAKVASAATCTPRTVDQGAKLTSNLVTVNVFNASNRSGLANRVEINLQRNGFLAGQIGNSTSAAKPDTVAILTNDRTDPRVALVAAEFVDKVTYVQPDVVVDEGVIVVVGDHFNGLRKKPPVAINAARAVTMCVPVVQLP